MGGLVPSSDLIKPPFKKKSNPNKQYENPEEPTIERKTDDTNWKDNLEVEDHKDNQDNEELIVKVATGLI